MNGPCPRCELYAHARGPRIRREIAKTSTGAKQRRERWRKFMQDYHDLHVKAGRFAALMAAVSDL